MSRSFASRSLVSAAVPRAYAEVAKELGLTQGSIGFTREKCLERLHRQLSKAGFN